MPRSPLRFIRATLIPPIRILGKPRPLHAHYAEALAGGSLHHYPTVQALENRRAEFLQPPDFGLDVVGFDVEMHAAFVLHALQLHHRFVGRRRELPVFVAAARMVHVHWPPQSGGPETGRLVNVGDVAINLHRAQAGVVHQCPSSFCRFARNSLSGFHCGHCWLLASWLPTSYSACVSSATPEKSQFGSKLSIGV